MSYEKIVNEAFENIIKLSTKLNEYDSKYLIKQIKIIANSVNATEDKISKLSAKNNKVLDSGYDDSFEYFQSLCVLHGYSDLEINVTKFPFFVKWFYNNALSTPIYKADRISKKILLSFFEAFTLFEFTYDRFPNDYLELRKFLLSWDTVIDEKAKEEILNLTPEK